jgi:hypothetical protein
MFRSLVCLICWVGMVGGESVLAAATQSTGAECRLAEQGAKRVRRLGNRRGTIHFAPSVEMNGTLAADHHSARPDPASEPTWLHAADGWNGSVTTEHGPGDRESAAALFPTQALSAETE